MVAWLSWLFNAKTGAEQPPRAPLDELCALRIQRHRLIDHLSALHAHGFDTLAQDDEAALEAIDKRILVLRLGSGLPAGPEDLPTP
jgi:hypothetical protein